MHFTRVKKRICQTWQLYSWQDLNGVEKFDASFPSEYNYTVSFKEFETREDKRRNKEWEGYFTSTYVVTPGIKWGLPNNKKILKSETLREAKIVKLTETEFWLEDGQDPVNSLNFKLIKYKKQ